MLYLIILIVGLLIGTIGIALINALTTIIEGSVELFVIFINDKAAKIQSNIAESADDDTSAQVIGFTIPTEESEQCDD